MRRIIVRADDLGYSEGVNLGIEKSVRNGIVTSVGLMANMEAAQHGVELVEDLSFCLGLHCNISAGRPLINPELIPSLVDENGYFKASKLYREADNDFVVYEEVLLEIQAQYNRFVELTSHKPCYMDVHAVYSKNFYQAVADVAKKHGVDYDLFNLDQPNHFRNTDIYVSMESTKPDYDPLTAFKQAAIEKYPKHAVGMFIVHPGYLDAYLLKNSSLLNQRAYELEMLVSQEVKDWIQDNQIELISYSDLI